MLHFSAFFNGAALRADFSIEKSGLNFTPFFLNGQLFLTGFIAVFLGFGSAGFFNFFNVPAFRESGAGKKGPSFANPFKHGFPAFFTFYIGHLRLNLFNFIAFPVK